VLEPEGVAVSTISGYDTCGAPAPDPSRANACKTVLTSLGLEVKGARTVPRAQLLVRVERACELHVRIVLGRTSLVGFSMNEFSARQEIPGREATFVVPASAVRAGINTITIEHRFGMMGSTEVASLDLEPACR
jgi:hypothetical protein